MAFIHKGNLYIWCQLPQGYRNLQNIFQSAVMDILGYLGITVYIDVVFIGNNNEEEHLEQLQKVVERIMEACLKFDLKKCQLGWFHVDYLGVPGIT